MPLIMQVEQKFAERDNGIFTGEIKIVLLTGFSDKPLNNNIVNKKNLNIRTKFDLMLLRGAKLYFSLNKANKIV